MAAVRRYGPRILPTSVQSGTDMMRLILLALLPFLINGVYAQNKDPETTLYRRSYFYVGGTYVAQGNSSIMEGAMYVERLTPQHVTQPFPLVLVHGHGEIEIMHSRPYQFSRILTCQL